MWLYLCNVRASEPITSIDTSGLKHRKRQAPKRIAASAALMGGAIVALSAANVSGVAAKSLSQAMSAGTSGLATVWAMPGAQPPVSGTASRANAGAPALAPTLPASPERGQGRSFLRDDLRTSPLVALALNKSIVVEVCRANPSFCAPLATPANSHEWSGRVVVSTGNAAATTGLAGLGVTRVGNSTLSNAMPLSMPAAETGTYAGEIKSGVGAAWIFSELPEDLAAQVKRILTGQLKVTGSAQAGDYYRIVYEAAGTDTPGSPRRRVTALEIRVANRTYRAVWFAAPGRGTGDYYSFDGQHLAAEPFAMPLNYVRISSPFGFRIHPVFGEPSFHTGVDLTAAQGTPVVAAAAGTVQFVGVDSGYGKHVVVRHAGGYTTYYAHLSAFAPGLRVGAQIGQGDSVGAVGQTGVATGPHLHFEVRLNNRPVEPLRLTSRFSAVPLAGRQRAAFDQLASVAGNQLARSSDALRTASNVSFN